MNRRTMHYVAAPADGRFLRRLGRRGTGPDDRHRRPRVHRAQQQRSAVSTPTGGHA